MKEQYNFTEKVASVTVQQLYYDNMFPDYLKRYITVD